MIIGISGKMGSGKDTVAKMLQHLKAKDNNSFFNSNFKNWKDDYLSTISGLQIKKFSDNLKECVAIILGCTREQLEDRDFKNRKLGEEWNKYVIYSESVAKLHPSLEGYMYSEFVSYSECKEYLDNKIISVFPDAIIKKQELTVRRFMQLLGSECGRDIIHPSIWVNSLMKEYLPIGTYEYSENYIINYPNKKHKEDIYPTWIITDARLENEIDAIKNRGGYMIKVVRNSIEENSNCKGLSESEKAILQHRSETDLDKIPNEKFDYIIYSEDGLDELSAHVNKLYNDKIKCFLTI